MWKSKFNNLQLKSENTLSKSQMRHIKGGGSASADCSNGVTVSCSGGVCTATDGSGCECTNSDGTNDKKSCKKSPFIAIR
ncbi:hypothetical protein BKI52_43550 [marine bacterium AO1-C]|nr:hypothetical protein BKI52_43550 [marine bacterium AO1-C]